MGRLTLSMNMMKITSTKKFFNFAAKYNIHVSGREKFVSLSGNRTPVFHVTGGDTNHYTNRADLDIRLNDS